MISNPKGTSKKIHAVKKYPEISVEILISNFRFILKIHITTPLNMRNAKNPHIPSMSFLLENIVFPTVKTI